MRTWESPARRPANDAVELDLVVEIGAADVAGGVDGVELEDVRADLDGDLDAVRSWNRFLYVIAGIVAAGIVALVLLVTLGGAGPPDTVRDTPPPCVVDMADSWLDPAC